MKGQEDTKKKTRDLKISLVVFALLTIFTICFLFYLNNLLPEFMMKQGKKYLEIGFNEKALKLFDMASKSLPYSCEPIYYKAITYSKMPLSYKNQRILYEYSKASDCDNVSEEVTKILNSMRNYYFKTSGESYIDNVLFKDKLIRWNNNDFITYYIENKDALPKTYIENIRRAFFNWQIATNSEIKFKEIDTRKKAKIQIDFVEKLNNENHIGHTTPIFNKNKLSKMQIKIKKADEKNNNYTSDTLLSVLQHEIGHALGIWGHSANKEDVMWYDGDKTSNQQMKVISPRDANTITMIYKMIPDIIDEPLSDEQKNYLYFHNILTTYPGKNFEHEINTALLKLKDNPAEIKKWIALVEDFQKARQYERANYILLKLLPVIKAKEQRYIVLYNISKNLYKLKDYQNANKFIRLALSINKEKKSQLLEAILSMKIGDLETAHLKLSILTHDYPADIEIALNLAQIYNMVGDEAKEKQVIKNLVKNNPTALKDAKVLKYKNNKKTD